jgi:hypothetical protein
MRRTVLVVSLLLSGCSGSGFMRYQEDTFTLPWQNPNAPVGSSENFQRAKLGAKTMGTPLLTEAGDIWPGPPLPVPTLKDLQKQQMAEINNQAGNPGAGLTPLPALPSLPGYEIAPQEPGHAAPAQTFSGNVVPLAGGRGAPLTGGENYKEIGGGNGLPSSIVVPNGNGTSTVIGPTGNVTTIPTPPK